MDAIRFAVVGCGNIAEGYHLPALAALDGGAFVVACDIEKERAARVAGKFGAREWAGDYREIVARDDVDLVCIFTKIDTHAEIAMAAADAGKHVFVQKPLAPTLRQGRAMADAARANGTQLVTSFMHSYFPESLAAAELIRAGRIGRIEHIRQRNATRNPLASAPSYGGALMDIGAHGIALIQALSGQGIVRVAARIEGEEASADGNGAPEDRRLQGNEVNAWLLYELSGGATASHEVQWSQPGGTSRFQTEIYGSEGSLHLRVPRTGEPLAMTSHSEATDASKQDPGWTLPDVPDTPNGIAHHQALLDRIRNGSDVPPGQEGLSVLAVCEAARRSAATGAWAEVWAGS